MKNTLIAVLLAGSVALAAGGITFSGTPVSFVDCPADGGAAQALTIGPNLLVTTTETVYVCLTRDGGGCPNSSATARMIPAGGMMQTNLSTDQTYASCHSAGATGDLQIGPAE